MKSECSDYQKKIAASLLGDLTEEGKKALEEHLSTCSPCRSERDSYVRTLHQLESAPDEALPRHFMVYPESRILNPWQLFFQLDLRWQALLLGTAILFLLLGVAAISRLQIRSSADSWTISFGQPDIDLAKFREDILADANRQGQEATTARIQEVRSEILHSQIELKRQQEVQIAAAMARIDSQTTGHITSSSAEVRKDTQNLVSDVYRVIAQQRAQDLEAINLRLDSADANNAIKATQTNEILGTLLQVADLKLRQ